MIPETSACEDSVVVVRRAEIRAPHDARFREAISKEDVRGRDRAYKLAMVDPALALTTARAIVSPWYRTQALSYVIRHGSVDMAVSALNLARQAAASETDAYRQVAVMAWPI